MCPAAGDKSPAAGDKSPAAGDRGPAAGDMGGPAGAGPGRQASSGGRPGRRLPFVNARNGRRVEFDGAHLTASIERARRSARHGDADLSGEVADITAFTLAAQAVAAAEASRDGDAPQAQVVEVEEIGRVVERVLVELGLARVAREYILARDRKARGRVASGAEARGGSTHTAAGAHARRLPAVRTASGTEPFDSRKIIAALAWEAELALDQATRVADRVEETLAGTALRQVSTALVRELVSNELLSLGLQDALRRHEAVGVPRHDLTRAFEAATAPRPEARPAPGGRQERVLAPRFEDLAVASLLGRWTLEDLLPTECAEAHRSGDLHALELAAPHRSLTRSIPIGLLWDGDHGARTGAFDLVRQVGRCAADVSHGVFLEDVASTLSSLVTTRSGARAEREAAIVDLVLSLGGVASALGRDIGLVRFGGRGGVACGRAVRAIETAERAGGVSLRAFATLQEVEEALLGPGPEPAPDVETADAVERLLESGHLVPVWAPAGARWVGPGCLRRRGERSGLATGAAVALNLPRLARRAGPWREDTFMSLLMEAVGTAVDALDALSRVQDNARRVQGEFVAERVVHAIAPVGLLEALRILGDGVVRTDQGARVLGALADGAARMGDARGLSVRPASDFGDAAARRFARSDALRGSAEQHRLFSDLPRPERERVNVYSSGLGSLASPGRADLGDVQRWSEGLGALLATLPAGAFLPPAGGARSLESAAERREGGLGGPWPPAARRPAGEAGGEPEGGARGDAGGQREQDSALPAREFALAALRDDRPRFAAWSRFARMRESGDAQEAPSAVKTLF